METLSTIPARYIIWLFVVLFVGFLIGKQFRKTGSTHTISAQKTAPEKKEAEVKTPEKKKPETKTAADVTEKTSTEVKDN